MRWLGLARLRLTVYNGADEDGGVYVCGVGGSGGSLAEGGSDVSWVWDSDLGVR